jgi:hypothetical protein
MENVEGADGAHMAEATSKETTTTSNSIPSIFSLNTQDMK